MKIYEKSAFDYGSCRGLYSREKTSYSKRGKRRTDSQCEKGDSDVYVIEDCCQTNREFGQIAALRFLKICTKEIIRVKNLPFYFKD